MCIRDRRNSCGQILSGGTLFLPDRLCASGDRKRDGIYDPAQRESVYADGIRVKVI